MVFASSRVSPDLSISLTIFIPSGNRIGSASRTPSVSNFPSMFEGSAALFGEGVYSLMDVFLLIIFASLFF